MAIAWPMTCDDGMQFCFRLSLIDAISDFGTFYDHPPHPHHQHPDSSAKKQKLEGVCAFFAYRLLY